MAIRFGTSGWRAIIADEFTFANVRRVTRAVCRHLWEDGAGGGETLVVGYDTRFMGEEFAETCVEELSAAGFAALVCNQPAPTPAISHAVRHRRAAGAINFTASPNPLEYNGMRFLTADGAPAPAEVTQRVEAFLDESDEAGPLSVAGGASAAEPFDPQPAYVADLESTVRFDIIARAGGRYAYDPLWGAGRGYLDFALRKHGLGVETIHNRRDVLFGGRAPEPDSEHLDELREVMRREGCVLGLATDGDAARCGVLDADGTFITPNELLALLFDYLIESRGWAGGVARSVATSHLVDRVAAARELPVYETPVGFDRIGELITRDKITLGGEESGGLSVRGHCPEQDGIIACLLAAEAVAARGASLSEQLGALYGRVGRLEAARAEVRLTPELIRVLPRKLAREPVSVGGRRVARVNRLDGVKFIFADGSWLLLRPSGAEPLVRIYAESETQKDLEVLLEHGRKFLLD